MSSVPRWPGAAGKIWIAREDGGAVVHLSGEIDTGAVAAFEECPERDTGVEGSVVAVDGAGVTFFGSVGVRLLLRLTEQTRRSGRRPLIRGATRPLIRLLELTGLDQVFEVVPDEGRPIDGPGAR